MINSISIKKIMKLIFNYLQSLMVIFLRILGRIDYPVPPNSSMRKTSSTSIKHYYESGLSTSLPIATCAFLESVNLRENVRVLDFGCGVGRQLLHFTRNFPKPNYYACDIDDISIGFIMDNYPGVEAYTSKFRPPLNYEDNFFDMVYSVSIFSHLCIEDQIPWLKEIARITKKGGICLLTVEGMTALGSLAKNFNADVSKLRDELKTKGFLYKEYEHLVIEKQEQGIMKIATMAAGIDGSYGNILLSQDYVRSEWCKYGFEVVNIIEGIIDFRQDLIVLRRE
jgi:SAM-dependent methyltransferase